MSSRERLAGIVAITITSVSWGTIGTAATFAPEAGPLAIGAAALGIGGLLQAVVAMPALRAARQQLRTHARLIAVGALAVAVHPLAFYSSMHYAGVAIGSVVSIALAPLASGLLELLVEHKRLSIWWVLSAGLGLIGSVVLCVSRFGQDTTASTATIVGVLLGLIAGATYATYSWVARRLMQDDISRAASMGAVFGSGGVLLVPVLLVTGAPLIASSQAFAVASYTAIVPMFLGYLLFGYGLTRVTASAATTITLIEPAVAAVLAIVIVGERLAPVGWVGLGIIAISFMVLVLAPTGQDVPVRSSLTRAPFAADEESAPINPAGNGPALRSVQ